MQSKKGANESTMVDDTKSRPNGSVLFQFIAAVVVSLQAGQYGIAGGWASPNIYYLKGNHSRLPSGQISVEEATWVTSILPIGIFTGSLLYGVIANRIGRKWSFISLTPIIILSWLLIAFAENVIYLYAARLIQGIFSGAIYSLCQFYFVEIADDRVRGTLCGTLVLAGHIGVVISFGLGVYSTDMSFPIVAIALTLLFVVIFVFFPDTPMFLLKQNKIAEAEKSIRFYKNLRSPATDQKIVDMEIERMRRTLENSEQKHASQSSFQWSDFGRNPGRKALIIGIVLAALNHITGSYALLNYTSLIFEASGSIMEPNESSLIVGIIQLIGTFVVPICIDRYGRKVLYCISTLGAAVGFAVLGVYMMLKDQHVAVEAYNWIPITSFSYIVFVQSLGVSTLSYTVIVETMPENLREVGVSLTNAVLSASSFIVLKFMPTLSNALGFYFTMYLFGAISIPCGLFIIFYVPETKGKTYQEIMRLLNK